MSGLKQLIGSELSSVCFVRDYVELHFDGPILRCLAEPVIESNSTVHRFPDSGSRDALCGLIGLVICGADDLSDRLSLHLAGNARVDIPKASDHAGPEVAHLVPVLSGELDVASMLIWENLQPS